ncbi:MAG: NADH:ubiquinone oxidoreductase, partial [Candidatus Natronoplasma sp.]
MSDKPKAAFFDFAGCEGDQLQVANLEEQILDLLNIVEVVSFREVMKEHSDDYDIAFIEGSATTPHSEERLKEIRKNADIVVAIGSCATIGGI